MRRSGASFACYVPHPKCVIANGSIAGESDIGLRRRLPVGLPCETKEVAIELLPAAIEVFNRMIGAHFSMRLDSVTAVSRRRSRRYPAHHQPLARGLARREARGTAYFAYSFVTLLIAGTAFASS